MTEKEYAAFVKKKWVNESMSYHYAPFESDVVAAALGIAGEAGEVVDAIKKATAGGRGLSREKVKEELGDLEFYLQKLRSMLNITRKEILEDNVDKLNKRYPDR